MLKRRALIISLLIVIAAVGIFFYDKNSAISISKDFDIKEKNTVTTLNFDVKEANVYTIKIDFANTNDENRKLLFSMPLSFSMKLTKDNEIMIDENYSINGISGQNKDKSAFREISKILLEEGSYKIMISPTNDEPELNELGPKLTVSRLNSSSYM